MTSFVVRPFVIEIESGLPKILVFLMSQKHNSKGVHFGKQSWNERITCSHNSSSWPEAILTGTVKTRHEYCKLVVDMLTLACLSNNCRLFLCSLMTPKMGWHYFTASLLNEIHYNKIDCFTI